MTEALMLTDDEVVALAVRRPSPWPGGIPTVDSSEESLSASVFRGNRSLFVRGLQPDGDESPATATGLVDAVLDAPARLVVYLADAEFRRNSWGIASAHHIGPEDWMFENVSPVGIHQLAWQPLEDHRTYITALLSAAVESGPEHGSDTAASSEWLCVLAETDAEGVLVAARLGELLMADVTLGGDGPVLGDQATASVDAAIERLFSTAAGRVAD